MNGTLQDKRERDAVAISYRSGVRPAVPAQSQLMAQFTRDGRRDEYPYPWCHMPSNGRAFNKRGAVEAPAYDAANQVVIATLVVPAGYRGVLRKVFTGYSGTGYAVGSGFVVWDIDINTPLGVVGGGYSLPDFAAMTLPLGGVAYPWPLEGGWLLSEGDTVRVKAYTVSTVGVGPGAVVFGGLIGWLWPVA
jgi:hypothetical protein